jgi:Tfp pilus assembly protein PilX
MWCSGTIRSGAAERGFVLATTLLVTTLLTVMLAAAFLLVSAEQRTTDNSFGSSRALALAQAGLQNYFSQNRGLADSSSYDSTRIPLVLGYADVVARKVRPSGASSGSPLALWVVRSSGVATSPVLSGQTQGARTIAQFAQLNLGVLPARAALVTLNGVAVTGNPSDAYPLSGEDLSTSICTGNPGGAAADTFGVSVPNARYSDVGTTPPTSRYGIATVEPYGSYGPLYDSTHVDWASLLAGNFLPDFTIPPGSWPAQGNTNYLVAYVPSDATLPSVPGGTPGMRGLLVVKGNLRLAEDSHWDGIILVGGYLAAAPGTDYLLHGMVVTGLNRALGQVVPPDTVERGMQHIKWSWCYARIAINSLSSLVPVTNAWADTWTTY